MSSIVCGIDEAGRGPVIGPMVIAVACVEEKDLDSLREIGVRDSKELTRAQRQTLYERLKKVLLYQDYVIVSPEEIDRYVRENKLNILELEKIRELIEKVIEKFPDKKIIVYVDSPDVNAERFSKVLKTSLNSDRVEIYAKHRADSTIPIVSAASIIAKYVRDREIEKLKIRYGDFGSGYPSDPRTIRFLISYISKHGEPPPIARKTWKTCRNIIRELKKRKLFE
ncbi:MAG: ribonuclease HII [Crenarchaeota archaeon]|nr:ribonuclease HII [Thermoproteota archaeon]